MKFQKTDRISDRKSFWRYHLPYVLEKVEWKGLKHVYLPVNRDYKPIGYMPTLTGAKSWVNYSDYSHQFIQFGTDPNTFKDVWWTPLALYDDGDASRVTYFERLGRLTERGKLANPPRPDQW